MRVGIAGCAGTGKSILGERLAALLGVPFLPSKDVTGHILRRDEYDYASGQQVEKFLATRDRQLEILSMTREQHSVEAFVSDRTAIDLAAYAILEMEGPLNVQRYVEECRALAGVYTHIVFCPWERREIADNHKRTLDPWYQFSVHSVELAVAEYFGIEMQWMFRSDVEGRLNELQGVFVPVPGNNSLITAPEMASVDPITI